MTDTVSRFIANVVGRVDGPLAFRLVLQPAMAAIAALKAGLEDGRSNRPAYFWAVIANRPHRRSLLRDGWKDIGSIFALAVAVDVVYQLIVLRWVYPGESLLVAVLLAVVPYLTIRGPVGRIMRGVAMPPTLTGLDQATRLAADRTFLAHERTMMAWVRT